MKKENIKRKLWKVFAIDILFIIIFVLLFFFIRKSLISYVGTLQLLQGNLQNINTANIEQANSIIQSLSRSATRAYIYTFILAPLILFLVYVLIQGLSWKIVNKRDKIYFLKFGLISIHLYVFTDVSFVHNNIFLVLVFWISGIYFSFYW